jgi:hypothetical protein
VLVIHGIGHGSGTRNNAAWARTTVSELATQARALGQISVRRGSGAGQLQQQHGSASSDGESRRKHWRLGG